MKHFKVKVGFGNDDFISIDETELRSAIKAQGNGSVGVFKEGTISGNHIISILPNWNKVMGWNRDYQLVAEDWDYIGKQTVNEYRDFLENMISDIKGLPHKEDNKFLSEESKKLSSKFQI